jgi:hypothetical protein
MAKKIKIVALLPLLAYGLPQSEGQSVSVEKKQADEIIEAGYAKLYTAVKGEVLIEEEGTEEEGVDSEGTEE